MDSDDNMLDAMGSASEGEQEFESDFMPSDHEVQTSDESDYGFDDNGVDDEPLLASNRSQSTYLVLSEKDIRLRQEEAASRVSSVLHISPTHAVILLRHFKWSISKVNDEWFADEDAVRNKVGLLRVTLVEPPSHTRDVYCGICFESYRPYSMKATICGHNFCIVCWGGYFYTAINDGPGCLTLRCPDPSCHAAVDEEMVLSLVPDDDRAKYMRYVLRSYVEDNRKTKWCPAPNCEYAVEFIMGSGPFDIVCKCGYSFCWNCLEEAHRPVDCETVGKWILKNCAESENMNWILANSKPCPKCKRPIEKNQGCMHITCTPPCKSEFCWLCLGAWSEHGERTGGFYACNRYETAKQEGLYDETERRREMAKNSLERYTHYYERWATNESSRAKAVSDLHQMHAVQIEKLSDKQCQPVSQLKFIIEAWLQIIECRRVLKWTYAYGYYLPENENGKRQFFEYMQGEAESGLERLHQCAEKDLQIFFDAETPNPGFNDFRAKLAGLTSVTKHFFESLVGALEMGLSDVNAKVSAKPGCCPKPSTNSKGRPGRNKVGTSKSGSSKMADDSNH